MDGVVLLVLVLGGEHDVGGQLGAPGLLHDPQVPASHEHLDRPPARDAPRARRRGDGLGGDPLGHPLHVLVAERDGVLRLGGDHAVSRHTDQPCEHRAEGGEGQEEAGEGRGAHGSHGRQGWRRRNGDPLEDPGAPVVGHEVLGTGAGLR